jgi:hypothetical protein
MSDIFPAGVLWLVLAIYVHLPYRNSSLLVEQALACVELAKRQKRRRGGWLGH